MNILTKIKREAAKRGATVIDCGKGHVQIQGALLVNYYPESVKRTAYIAGTVGGKKHVTPEEAVAMAFRAPEFVPVPQKRKKQRSAKVRMFRKSDQCHWCRIRLTLETATVDHVIPLSRGGLDNDCNRVLACEPCNRKRGHAMPEIHGGEA